MSSSSSYAGERAWLVCKEDVRKRAQKIKVMCLKPADGASGAYVVDPEYNGETGNAWKDTALCTLIFDARPVTHEVYHSVRLNNRSGGGRCVGHSMASQERGRPAPLAAFATPRHHPVVRARRFEPGRAPTQLLTLRCCFAKF